MNYICLLYLNYTFTADGICHTYLDQYADILHSRNSSSCLPMQSIKIVVDAKTDYPAACNAMETLLVHERLLDTDVFYKVQTTHNLVYILCLEGLQGLESGWC